MKDIINDNNFVMLNLKLQIITSLFDKLRDDVCLVILDLDSLSIYDALDWISNNPTKLNNYTLIIGMQKNIELTKYFDLVDKGIFWFASNVGEAIKIFNNLAN